MAAFKGAGIVYIAPYASAATFSARNFRDTGNNSVVQDAFTEDKQEQTNYRTPAGGVYASISRISGFTLQIDMHDFTADNLALALWGTSAADLTTAVTDEAHTLHAGGVVVLDRICDDTQTVVITAGATTVLSADYTVSGSAITFASTLTTGGVSDGDAILIDYTAKAENIIQALTDSSPTVSVFFDGVNAVDSKKMQRRYYKVKVGAPAGVDSISESFATLSLPCTVEADTTVVGTGLSQYVAIRQEQ
ncbi:phage tail tube protein [Denitromonas halophila]|uniref:Phage tail protein n=1 Tax=Denitromonas halophila TaxID=1629404 RepID=A0A557QLS2_9RHOO|nr:hypothetical protein [Denitromonas halophila]TVO53856.1 hypothetical protein FHP91_13750 [Denitromonas halophila]